jgi:hypothetical protein
MGFHFFSFRFSFFMDFPSFMLLAWRRCEYESTSGRVGRWVVSDGCENKRETFFGSTKIHHRFLPVLLEWATQSAFLS